MVDHSDADIKYNIGRKTSEKAEFSTKVAPYKTIKNEVTYN